MARTAAGRHRATRPRYGRLTALAGSVSVVVVALVGSAGGWDDAADDARPAAEETSVAAGVPTPAVSSPAPAPAASKQSAPSRAASRSTSQPAPVPPASAAAAQAADPRVVPADSGEGRRVVFDQSAQRVWLVGSGDHAERSYLASGSVLDNLDPGTYQVYSRSRWAVGVDDSGVMEYFVRFTRGPSGAAIGFHTIPTKDGVPLQGESELGSPRSHGCIRQRTEDAIALWEFAPEGTTVVVVA